MPKQLFMIFGLSLIGSLCHAQNMPPSNGEALIQLDMNTAILSCIQTFNGTIDGDTHGGGPTIACVKGDKWFFSITYDEANHIICAKMLVDIKQMINRYGAHFVVTKGPTGDVIYAWSQQNNQYMVRMITGHHLTVGVWFKPEVIQ